MTARKLIRWSGVPSVLAGLWTVAIAFVPEGSPQSWVYALGTILMIFTVFGVYGAQIEESGIWGLAGFIGVVVGEVLFMTQASPQDPLGLLAGSLYALGLLALAIGTLRAGVFSKRAPILWLAAIVIGLPGYAIASLEGLLVTLASLAFGLGFILIGLELWSGPFIVDRSTLRTGSAPPREIRGDPAPGSGQSANISGLESS
jgi:hypothetical protein